jgi:hypothetical protein
MALRYAAIGVPLAPVAFASQGSQAQAMSGCAAKLGHTASLPSLCLFSGRCWGRRESCLGRTARAVLAGVFCRLLRRCRALWTWWRPPLPPLIGSAAASCCPRPPALGRRGRLRRDVALIGVVRLLGRQIAVQHAIPRGEVRIVDQLVEEDLVQPVKRIDTGQHLRVVCRLRVLRHLVRAPAGLAQPQLLGGSPSEHHEAAGSDHLEQHLRAGVRVGVQRHDVDRLGGLREHHREPEPPVAEYCQLRAQHGAARGGNADGLRPHPQDVVDVLFDGAGEEALEVGLVPHPPVLDVVAIAADGGVHEGIPVVAIGRGHMAGLAAVGPGGRIGQRGKDVEAPRPGVADHGVGRGPVVDPALGLDHEPVEVHADPSDPGRRHAVQQGAGGQVGVDAVGQRRIGGHRGARSHVSEEEGGSKEPDKRPHMFASMEGGDPTLPLARQVWLNANAIPALVCCV